MIGSVCVFFYLLDRCLRLAAISHFFRRNPPPGLTTWPSVTMIQPITRGATNLAGNLHARFRQVYGGEIQHVLVCDQDDQTSQGVCTRVKAAHPATDAHIVQVGTRSDRGHPAIASKIEKLNAGVATATGEIFCFIDDDIEPPPDMLRRFVGYLHQPQIGAVFGLAYAASWQTPWSTLMSLFVNCNGLSTYVPISYLGEPAQITGHLFAVRACDLHRVQGWKAMEQRLDDDTELTYKLRAIGLRSLQTPVIYNVYNEFNSWHAYAKQLQRWFVFPKQTVLPHLGWKEKALSALMSLGMIIPVLILLQTLVTPGWLAFANLAVVTGLFYATTARIVTRYARSTLPFRAWLLMPITLFVAPLQMLRALFFAEPVIEWRGQTLRVERGGKFHRVDANGKG